MRSVSALLGVLDISKREAIEPIQARDLSIYCRDGDEDNPGDEPDGEEHESQQAKEANEEVSIQAVYTPDVLDISPPYCEWPSEETLRQTWDAFPNPGHQVIRLLCGEMHARKHERFRGNVGPGFVNGSEVGSHESECDDLYGKRCRVEDEGSHELTGGLALGSCEVGGPARDA